MIWTVPLPYHRPPLSLNDRKHWGATSGPRAELRRATALLARSAGIPRNLPHIHTRLHWCPPDNRRRDEDNIIATAKPCWDGLVDAGVVDDDNSKYMTKYMPRIHKGRKDMQGRPRLWLEVWITRGDTDQ